MLPTESAVIVAVPQAEPVVGRFLAELDRSAGWGVPPHVTVLYPFVPPDRVDEAVLSLLAEAVASVPAFDVAFAEFSWFGDAVLWLAPEPSQPFCALTEAVWARFPDHAPYAGAFADLVPHLTVGHDAPVDVLRAAAAAIRPRLPVRGRVAEARLIQGSAEPDSWRTVANLPLGPGNEAISGIWPIPPPWNGPDPGCCPYVEELFDAGGLFDGGGDPA